MRRIPVTKPYLGHEEEEAVCGVLRSGWVAQGSKVAEFEKMIAEHEGIEEGIAVTSCTSALQLAMEVSGIRAGMDVIVPAFTFVATANAVVASGAVPVFADIQEATYNIDPAAVRKLIENDYIIKKGKLQNKETGNCLWGIVPVHQFGLCCDIDEINKIAEEYHLLVIEDAACALGSKIGDIHEGAFGNISCVSFHPRKSITTGEGGMVLTNNAESARRMRELRSHGCSVSADARDKGKGFLLPAFKEAGYNYRMTDIQAAVGIEQVKKLDHIIDQKIKKAQIYNRFIQERIPELAAPYVPDGYFHTYQSYVCMLDYKKAGLNSVQSGEAFRNKLLEKLENYGILTRQGTHAVHMLEYYKKRFGNMPEKFKNACKADRLSIALPLYVQMSEADQAYVTDTFRKLLDEMK